VTHVAPEADPAAPQPHRAGGLVAFDFDGTLTVKDSFNAFLAWRTPPLRLLAGALALGPAGLRYLADRDRGAIKSAAVRALLGGLPRLQIAAEAEAFAEACAQQLFRPDALARWKAHQAAGDEVVIVTASPEDVIAPFARRLGAHRLIGTRLHSDGQDRLTGDFDGPNCRAAEKVVRLEAIYGPGVRLKAAYGDTSGDVEMLARADQPFMRLFQGRPGPA
jgi:phosphatidylglycerophosphatase C